MRVCTKCKYIWHEKHTTCKKCGFGSYSAISVFGNRLRAYFAWLKQEINSRKPKKGKKKSWK